MVSKFPEQIYCADYGSNLVMLLVSVNMAQVHQLEPEEATPNLGEGKQS